MRESNAEDGLGEHQSDPKRQNDDWHARVEGTVADVEVSVDIEGNEYRGERIYMAVVNQLDELKQEMEESE